MGFRDSIRHSVPGSTEFYEGLRTRWKSRQTQGRARSLVDLAAPINLDVGAGDAARPDWITLDISDGCDLFWDLRRGIPFPDAVVDTVYSSHLLEHMDYDAGQALLRETLRVLKPGGTISVCVPNARLYVDAYLGEHELAPDHDFWAPALRGSSRISLLNYVAYMGGEHKCLFDVESLLERLAAAWFVDERQRPFDPTIDLAEREFESIYAVARKA